MTVPTQTDEGVGLDAAAATTGASVIRGGLWFLVSGLLPQVFTLILSIAAARFLGPDAMGRQSFIAFASLSTTTVLGSGLALAVMRAVAEALGARRPAEARGLVAWARRVQLGGAVAGGAVMLAPALAGSEPRLAWTLAASATLLGILQTVPNCVLFATQRFRNVALIGLVTGGAAVPTMIAVLALGGGISGMFGVELVMVAANLGWTSLLSRRALDAVAPAEARDDPSMRRSATRYALYATAGGLLTLVVWRRSEFFFLERYSTDAEIALYSIAFAAATVLTMISEKLASVMSSAFATVYGAGRLDRLHSGYARTLRLLFLLGLPLLALAAGGGPAAIRVVYGEAYADSGAVLLVLLLAIPLMPLWSVGASMLAAVGDGRSPLIAVAVAAVLNLALAITLVPRLDAIGAAIANVSAQVVATLLVARAARRVVGRSVARLRPGPVLRTLAASAVAGVATWGVAEGLGGPAGLVGGIAAGLGLLWAGFAVLKPLDPDDAEWLDEQVGERLGGVGAAARRFGRAVPAGGLRLAVYSEAPIVGGAEQSLGNLLARLDPAIDVTVVGTHEPTLQALAARRPGARVAAVPHIRGKADLPGMLRLAAALRRLRPDVLQVTLPTPWACRHAMFVATLLPGLRVIAVEQLPTPAPDGWQRALKRFASRRLAAHVSVGRTAAREVERAVGLPEGAVGIIHNGVEPEPGAPAAERPDAPLFGTLARLVPQKGLEDWLRALALVPEAHAVLVGDGPLREELLALADELGVGGRVSFEGWSDDARRRLEGWDAFVLPSHYEGFPLSVVEAMLQGVPVIATDVGSVGEAVVDGETGLLVPPRDPEALAAAARRLLADPELAARIAARGRELAHERYTAAAMAIAYEALYAEVLGR